MKLPAPILFFGLSGQLSAAPLAALLHAGADIAAVVISTGPGQTAEIAAVSSSQSAPVAPGAGRRHLVAELAREAGLPLFAVRKLGSQAQEELAALQPAIACVACWPERIPAALLERPRHGFLNLHPSLLPAYRGPHPLFWALRDGRRESGVTVHWMNAELDRGDIAAQAPLAFPEGVGPAVLAHAAGELGATLLVGVLQQIAAGIAEHHPQPSGGSYQPAPRPADFMLETTWSAQHAYNFMRGTSGWGNPYPIRAGGETYTLRQALGYDPAGTLPAPVMRTETGLQLQFTPGVLLASE
jgi:methionyl-tRNA formyltransferase